jgi:hypothetical protein
MTSPWLTDLMILLADDARNVRCAFRGSLEMKLALRPGSGSEYASSDNVE